MILAIILIVCVIVGIIINYRDEYDIGGFLTAVICGIVLVIHLALFLTVSYDYELFVTRRESFQLTLDQARKNNNPYETAAIVKDVSKWNEKLAARKYNNKTLFLDQYNDDRIEDLEPIK